MHQPGAGNSKWLAGSAISMRVSPAITDSGDGISSHAFSLQCSRNDEHHRRQPARMGIDSANANATGPIVHGADHPTIAPRTVLPTRTLNCLMSCDFPVTRGTNTTTDFEAIGESALSSIINRK